MLRQSEQSCNRVPVNVSYTYTFFGTESIDRNLNIFDVLSLLCYIVATLRTKTLYALQCSNASAEAARLHHARRRLRATDIVEPVSNANL